MQRKTRFVTQVTQRMELWEEPLGSGSLVEISADNRVLIEKHYGIREYSSERICVCVSYGYLAVTGENMQLDHMQKDRLIIRGRIESVAIVRRKN